MNPVLLLQAGNDQTVGLPAGRSMVPNPFVDPSGDREAARLQISLMRLSTSAKSSATSVEAVACGAHHTALVTDRGTLHTFGRGERGQLGIGTCDDVLQPVLLKDFTSKSRVVTRVAACGSHTAAVTARGEVFTWG